MKISELIKELENIQKAYGDIPCQLQSEGLDVNVPIIDYESFFLVPEKYDEEGMILNIRSWPY